MLEKDDFKALREMFQDTLQENNKKNNAILRREIRDETRAMIVASEKSVIHQVRDETRTMIAASEESVIRTIRDETHSLIRASAHRIISEITEFIGSALLLQLDNHKMRITRLEQKAA